MKANGLLLIVFGMMTVLAQADPWNYDDHSEERSTHRRDVLEAMVGALTETNTSVVVAQYRRDGVLRDWCQHPEVFKDLNADPTGLWWVKLHELRLQRYFVSEVICSPSRLAVMIYATEQGGGRVTFGRFPHYSARLLADDSMWLLFLEPGHFRYDEALLQSVGERYDRQPSEWKIVYDHRRTNANELVLKRLGLEKELTRETWFWLKYDHARFELNQSCPALPALCPEATALTNELDRTLPFDPKKRDQDRMEKGILRPEFLVDLRLILKQMGGQTGADRFKKITATEKDMQTNLGKALLRELRSAVKTSAVPASTSVPR